MNELMKVFGQVSGTQRFDQIRISIASPRGTSIVVRIGTLRVDLDCTRIVSDRPLDVPDLVPGVRAPLVTVRRIRVDLDHACKVDDRPFPVALGAAGESSQV